MKDGILPKIMGTSRRILDGSYDQSTVAMAREWLERQGIPDKVRVPAIDELWPNWSPKDVDPEDRIELVELNEHNSCLLTAVGERIVAPE